MQFQLDAGVHHKTVESEPGIYGYCDCKGADGCPVDIGPLSAVAVAHPFYELAPYQIQADDEQYDCHVQYDKGTERVQESPSCVYCRGEYGRR